MLGYKFRTASSNSNGIGLGLYVSKGLVEKANGKIKIFSEGPQKGTIVEFSIHAEQNNSDASLAISTILCGGEKKLSEIISDKDNL